MQEERFEAIMEHFGNIVEKAAEGAADAADNSLNRAWKLRPVRFMGKALSLCTAAGLAAWSVSLREKGFLKTARFCLVSGALILAAHVLETLLFRKK